MIELYHYNVDNYHYNNKNQEGVTITKIVANDGSWKYKLINYSDLKATTPVGHYFDGWRLEENSSATPIKDGATITITGNVDLYAVYYSTTSDSLIMQDKTIPYGWRLNETRKYNKYVSLEENNNLIIPHLSNITKIEIDMTKNSTYEQILFISNTTKDTTFFAQATTNSDKVYTFEFDSPISTSLFFILN